VGEGGYRGGHIVRGELLGIRLTLAGREGSHVVERTHFHSYALR